VYVSTSVLIIDSVSQVCASCSAGGLGGTCVPLWNLYGGRRATIYCANCVSGHKRCSFRGQNWGITEYPQLKISAVSRNRRAEAAARRRTSGRVSVTAGVSGKAAGSSRKVPRTGGPTTDDATRSAKSRSKGKGRAVVPGTPENSEGEGDVVGGEGPAMVEVAGPGGPSSTNSMGGVLPYRTEPLLIVERALNDPNRTLLSLQQAEIQVRGYFLQNEGIVSGLLLAHRQHSAMTVQLQRRVEHEIRELRRARGDTASDYEGVYSGHAGGSTSGKNAET
jgi:hypothetical protein